MDMSVKDGLYFGSLIISIVWSYANTNKKIDMNKKELDNLRERIDLVIDKEKTLFEQEFKNIHKKIDTYFKKIDDLKEKIDVIEKNSITFIRKDEALKQHPTKEEIENKLTQLEKVDNSLKDEIISLKKDLSKKFDKIEKALEEHIKEERESFKHHQDTLNQILMVLKGKNV
jgi:chromosome segregation ATPase